MPKILFWRILTLSVYLPPNTNKRYEMMRRCYNINKIFNLPAP